VTFLRCSGDAGLDCNGDAHHRSDFEIAAADDALLGEKHHRELAQARNHEPFEFFGYSDHSWDYAGANIETFSGDHELARGITALETPGHTVGHCSFLLEGSGSPMLLAMDVSYTAAAMEKGIQPGFHHTPVDGVRSIARVKQVAADKGAEIFYSHDMDAWQGYKKAPDHYEL